jgi:hypothetical protein
MATGSTGQPSPVKTPSPHKLPPLSPKIEPIPIKVPPTDIHVPPPSPKTKPAPADKPPPPVTTPTADSSQPAWMDMLQEQEQAEKAVPAYISTGGGSAWITNAMNPPQESPPTPALETIEQNNLKATTLLNTSNLINVPNDPNLWAKRISILLATPATLSTMPSRGN